jgi:NAD(P)-dependent dehydrogenase (short-subunit alcohol dehydrogenase family)
LLSPSYLSAQEGHNAGMTASQKHEMKQQPDCGEERYRGSGKLAGKVAIVTGGDSGIGRAVVIAFAREGADIALVYNKHDEDATDTARFVEQAGRRCLLLKKDISTGPGAADEVVNATIQALGKVTTLVLNAGIQFEENSLDGITPENLTKTFETNVFANVWLSKAAVKHFKEHAGCTIIFNTSINAFAGNKSLISYSATKGAEQALCRCAWVGRERWLPRAARSVSSTCSTNCCPSAQRWPRTSWRRVSASMPSRRAR